MLPAVAGVAIAGHFESDSTEALLMLDGWRIARREDAVIAKSRFEVRGHIGAGWARGDNIYLESLKAAIPGILGSIVRGRGR